MKRPSFFQGVGVALAAALAAGVLHTALASLLGAEAALRLVVAGLGLGYVLYLLGRSAERTGRLTTLVAWSVLAALLSWLAPPLAPFVALHAGALWLVRSLYFHSSVLGALADLGLMAFALAAAFTALVHTASLAMGVWCFFLTQALFVAIPAVIPTRKGQPPAAEPDRFQQAHQAAESALRKLSTVR